MEQPVLAALAELGTLSDEQLWDFAASVREEQRRRSLAAGDLDAIVSDAFVTGFDSRGMAVDPWIHASGLLVCPGSKIHRSRQAHRCRFVAVGDRWVWESSERLVDEIRPVHDGKDSLQTVTVLAAWEGLVVDVVTSKATGGLHTRDSAVAFEVHRGLLRAGPSASTVTGHARR